MKQIRLLVVDDSRSMRLRIRTVLSDQADILVVGEAADPYEAREAIKALNPDVITLDVEMPRMNGLEFLDKLMRLRPTPVVMVSSLTGPNCDETLRALEIGAIDCVAKPEPGDPAPFSELADKVRAAAAVRWPVRSAPPQRTVAAAAESYASDGRVVAIGASTGGVEALTAVIANFPKGCPATVITQHMPRNFTKSFAKRLNDLCEANVSEACDGDPIEPGRVYLAPGGDMHLTISGSTRPVCRLVHGEPVNGHRPSVDMLFESVSKTFGAKAIGIILTGMGRDGARGLLSMRSAGARTIGQDEATSLIYGMPRVAFEIGGVERQLPLGKIGTTLLTMTQLRAD